MPERNAELTHGRFVGVRFSLAARLRRLKRGRAVVEAVPLKLEISSVKRDLAGSEDFVGCKLRIVMFSSQWKDLEIAGTQEIADEVKMNAYGWLLRAELLVDAPLQ